MSNVMIQNRDFSEILARPSLEFTVLRYSWNVMGGPKTVEIQVTGDAQDIWWLVERMRCPITLYSPETGEKVWWGYIAQAQFTYGAWDIDTSIDSMSNRIAVAYNDVDSVRKTTGWLEDAASVAEYGKKELLYSSPVITEAAAQGVRAMLLEAKKLPRPVITESGTPQSGTYTTARIHCRGWYDTLGWQYCSIPYLGNLGYVATTAIWQNVGDAVGTEKCFQQMLIETYSMNAISVWIYAQKQGDPTDALKCDLYALDGNGLPTGSTLASGSTDGGDMLTAGSPTWLKTELTPAATLTAGTLYGLVVSRSGSVDDTDYYQVNVNPALGYADGFYRLWNGTNWVARGTDADMCFNLIGDNLMDSTWIINNIAHQCGQFITAVDIAAASGVTTPAFNSGDNLALSTIQDLLNMGTSNLRRMLAGVDANRRMRVYEEPASSAARPYLLNKKRILNDPMDNQVRKDGCPVGVWTQLKDVLPGSLNLSIVADPSLSFLEESEYSPGTDNLALISTFSESPWSIGRTLDG